MAGHAAGPAPLTGALPSPLRLMNWVTAEEAVRVVTSGQRVFIHSVAAAPPALVAALAARAGELERVEVVHIHTEGPAPYVAPGMGGSFRHRALFVGGNVRDAVATGAADYVPVFLSEIPAMFRRRVLPLDVALLTVSPPDKHGYCSLGTSVDVSKAALESAAVVIAEVNPHMPRTLGDALVHASKLDYAVAVDTPLPEHAPAVPTPQDEAIGRHVAGLVEDGATLQMGIGAIPDAVLRALTGHRDLGIHTEMFAEGVIDLVERGVVTGRFKRRQPGKIVSSFVMGTKRLYAFLDDNPSVMMMESSYVNDTAIIRRNPKVTAINSAIEVDLTGQVCADSIGMRQYSGIGGQMDFVRGATLSEGGKPIIALPSVTSRGQTRIVSTLKEGAGVVTTRGHAQYVVTEHGVAYLYGKTLRERARALIDVAAPEHRAALERAALDRHGVLW